jgi:long-subunit fatty acid transport protein
MNIQSHSARFSGNLTDDNIYATDFSDEEAVNEGIIDDNDNGFSINAGVKWEPHPKISVGLIYRTGPEFMVTKKYGRGLEEQGWELDPGHPDYNKDFAEFTLKVPDSFGAGAAFQATDSLIVTVDVVHIQYKDLLKDFDPIMQDRELSYTEDNYTVDNVTEVHVGAEYALSLGKRFLALRTGVYYEPDHSIRFTGTTGDERADAFGRTLFPGGDDEVHITTGLGLLINDHFHIDLAANIANKIKQISVSAILGF